MKQKTFWQDLFHVMILIVKWYELEIIAWRINTKMSQNIQESSNKAGIALLGYCKTLYTLDNGSRDLWQRGLHAMLKILNRLWSHIHFHKPTYFYFKKIALFNHKLYWGTYINRLPINIHFSFLSCVVILCLYNN